MSSVSSLLRGFRINHQYPNIVRTVKKKDKLKNIHSFEASNWKNCIPKNVYPGSVFCVSTSGNELTATNEAGKYSKVTIVMILIHSESFTVVCAIFIISSFCF